VRALAMGELTAANALRFIGKEAVVGSLNGLLFATLLAVGVMLVFHDWRLGAVIAASMVCNLMAAALAGYRRIVTRQNATLLQDTVARWMNSGGFERHLRKMRRAYEGRMETLVSCLEAGKASGLPLSWAAPDGGMAIWADTGLDSVRAAELALRRGVYVHPGANYRLDRKPDTHLRLGFANQSPGEIEQGATLLFDALRSKTKT